jgi:spermidine/putrescine transport system substrate-binding protein
MTRGTTYRRRFARTSVRRKGTAVGTERRELIGQPAFGMSRRSLLRRGASTAAALSSVGWLASACGSDDDDDSADSGAGKPATPENLAGTVVFLNYPAWIGSASIKPFEAKYPKVEIKENSTALVESVAGTAVKVAQNPSAYDFLLADVPIQKQLDAGGFVYDLDFERIPNIAAVGERFRKEYPLGVPTDYGKIGFAYNSDVVKEKPQSWADLWEIAPKYSRKITALNIDRDIIGAALLYKGYSVNDVEDAALDAAKDALLELKPHIQAFKSVEVAKGLVTGDTAIAITGDYDVALVKAEQPKVEWVVPEEGFVGYLEGWTAVSKTESIDIFYAFSDFAMSPPQYAAAIEATGAAWVQEDITKLLPKNLASSDIIGTKDLDKVEFLDYIEPEGIEKVSKIWSEVISA